MKPVFIVLIFISCACTGFMLGTFMAMMVDEQNIRFAIHENTLRGDTRLIEYAGAF
tara:strand:+ start:1058 stop:1225 length:168 start_codon:yes stop_codon:yes gene_type:complete